MLAQASAMSLCVCVSVTCWHCGKMAEWIQLVFGTEVSLSLFCSVLKRNSGISKDNGTSLCFFPNSELSKLKLQGFLTLSNTFGVVDHMGPSAETCLICNPHWYRIFNETFQNISRLPEWEGPPVVQQQYPSQTMLLDGQCCVSVCMLLSWDSEMFDSLQAIPAGTAPGFSSWESSNYE